MSNRMREVRDFSNFGLRTTDDRDARILTDHSAAEYYGTSGHQPTNDNELFAGEENKEPWWKSQFFISQPVLFGMWDGVFTSCLINIFGVIIFLRSGWIVGQAGVVNAIFIVLCTIGIALISVLSAIGICERCRMESGGVYFLLTHVLGSRMAAAVGLIYVYGQAVGCALNLLGFGELMANLLEMTSNKWAERFFATCLLFLLWFINLVGVKWVIKLQFLLLVILLLAGLDFVVGCFVQIDIKNGFDGWFTGNFQKNLFPKYTDGYDWFTVFAVFFPSVTGVMAGINMSGDLRNPSKDIPNGTLAAMAAGTGLYLIFIIFLGGTCARWALSTDNTIAAKVSAVRILLFAGVYISSMSSCLGTMYGTPRVLQSIANENVIPFINCLGYGRGPNKVPVLATFAVAAIVIVFTLIGNVNSLAPIVTMPFLVTYAAVDYAYFALAQTFDIQHQRERRLHKSAPKINAADGSSAAAVDAAAATTSSADENDLNFLFPERNAAADIHQNAEESENLTVHGKRGNWYSKWCNRWLSLFGVGSTLLIMYKIDKTNAAFHIFMLFVIWCYIKLASPAVKPGAAAQFKLWKYSRKCILRLFGKHRIDYEEIIVTPVHPPEAFHQQRLTDENEDFANRKRFHQTATVNPVIGRNMSASDSVQILQ